MFASMQDPAWWELALLCVGWGFVFALIWNLLRR